MNLPRGLRRAWLVATILWVVYWLGYYFVGCKYYPAGVVANAFPYTQCYNVSYYTYIELFAAILKSMIGIPVLVFVLGAVVLWVGPWIAKGFRPSDHRFGGIPFECFLTPRPTSSPALGGLIHN